MSQRITTTQFAQLLGVKSKRIYKLIAEDIFFPSATLVRRRFEFDLDRSLSWMSNNDIKPKCNLDHLLGRHEVEVLTTSEVLTLMGRKICKGNRADLAAFVRQKRLPPPCEARRGGQGENIWVKSEIEACLKNNFFKRSRRSRKSAE